MSGGSTSKLKLGIGSNLTTGKLSQKASNLPNNPEKSRGLTV